MIARTAAALALVALVSGCETLKSGVPGVQAAIPDGWPGGSEPTVEVLCPDRGGHTYWINLAAGWEPSGPGTASVDGGREFAVRWHRTLAMGSWIGYAMVLAQSDDEIGLRDMIQVFQSRDDYTPPPPELRRFVEDGNELTVVFSGYGGDAVWVFDLAAVRAEAAACRST